MSEGYGGDVAVCMVEGEMLHLGFDIDAAARTCDISPKISRRRDNIKANL
jgi:hypothetical protein